MNQAEVSEVVQKVLECWRNQTNALGCSSDVGCIAGKRHFQEHKDKWASDMEDFKNYMKGNDAEKKEAATKLAGIHDAVLTMGGKMEQLTEIKEAIKTWDGKMWAVFMIIVGLAVGTIWASYKQSEAAARTAEYVKQINSVDIKNQTSTETYMAILVEQLSGKPIDAVVKEHMDKKRELEKITGGN